jgi:hypothetical protein
VTRSSGREPTMKAASSKTARTQRKTVKRLKIKILGHDSGCCKRLCACVCMRAPERDRTSEASETGTVLWAGPTEGKSVHVLPKFRFGEKSIVSPFWRRKSKKWEIILDQFFLLFQMVHISFVDLCPIWLLKYELLREIPVYIVRPVFEISPK